MSFAACVRAAVQAGSVRQEKADEAINAFDRAFRSRRANGETETQAMSSAAIDAMDYITQAKGAAKYARLKQMQAQWKYKTNVDGTARPFYEVPRAMLEHDPAIPLDNAVTSYSTKLGLYHSMLDEFLHEFRPRLLGLRGAPRGRSDLIVEELFGGNTGNQGAREMARAISRVIDFALTQANAAGADIPASKKWRLPQRQSWRKMEAAGRARWIEQHKLWLDWDEMTHFNDGKPILPNERETVLQRVFETITTDGANKIRPGVSAAESLASRLSHRRFLHYKDAASWRAANEAYGDGNAAVQVLAYLDSMARDVSMMEVFGPNPSATRDFITRDMRRRAADAQIGRQAAGEQVGRFSRREVGRVDGWAREFETAWDHHTMVNAMSEENPVGMAMAATRNFLTSSLLGSASLLAIPGDILKAVHVTAFNRTNTAGVIGEYLRQMNPASRADRSLAVRSGVIHEAASSIVTNHARYLGFVTGPQWSRRITDASLRASLLTGHTNGMRQAFVLEMMGTFADSAGRGFETLPFRGLLERYRITPEDWEIFRATAPHIERRAFGDAAFLRPNDIRARQDLDYETANSVADKFMDMINAERVTAVLEGTLFSRVLLTDSARAGTIPGEVVRSLAMFKSFPTTMAFMAMRGMLTRGTTMGRVGFVASLAAAMTLSGVLGVQSRQIAAGRDPLDMTTPEFWGAATIAGGGLAIFGDFLFSDVNRYGSGLSDMVAGPAIEFLNAIRNLTVGNLIELASGEDTNFARETAAFLSRYTPGVSTNFYAKLLLQRNITDQLLLDVDPAAYRRMREIERRSLRNYGQRYWWRPGRTSPDRGPDFNQMLPQ